MAMTFKDGFDQVDDDWASEFVSRSKEQFVDALSFVCVNCHCKTTISIPKYKAVDMTDLCCPVCKEVLLLTHTTVQSL
jgi:hypothetical protein